MNQKLVVVMPTLKRPEMLALALENLQMTIQARTLDLDVRICLDHTTDERLNEVEYVRNTYFPQAEIYRARNHVLCPGGTWNILQSLKLGWQTNAEYIFLVEEDVIVRSNFFEKHLEMQKSGDYFVTSGRKLPQLSQDYYTNPGCCFHRDKLALVIPHIRDAYFINTQEYCETNFEICPDAGFLDDGLIRRVMMSVNGKAMTAVPAIVRHIGFHYYNKMAEYRTEGTIQDRITQLREMLPRINPKDRYTGDFEPL